MAGAPLPRRVRYDGGPLMLRVIAASILLGFAAYAMARGVGLPLWSPAPGDAADVAICVAAAVLALGTVMLDRPAIDP